MIFSSYPFVLVFLPVVVLGCVLLGRVRARSGSVVLFLGFASLVFYAYWDWRFLWVILVSVGFNYLVGGAIARRREALANVIATLERAGVSVITFIPPLASRALRSLEQDAERHIYYQEVSTILAGLGGQFFDFLSAEHLGGNECEFIDGIHGGEITAARMLNAMAEVPGRGLAGYIDLTHIDTIIDPYAGHALADQRYRLPGEQETDFLGLGCAKHS